MSETETDQSTLSEDDIEDWFDSEETDGSARGFSDEDLSRKYAETQIRIVRTSLDFTLHTLVSSIQDKSYINLSPGYQRRARWDRRKKSLLIESFLLNVPVPPLFFFEKDYNQYEIMDGRQRLEAISEFVDNRYELIGCEFWPELDGKRFNQLPGTIQRGLLRRTINAVVLLAETSSDQNFDIRLVLFRRLNTGGVRLNPQELRNALYPGSFNKALHELSRDDLFASIWRIPKRTPKEDEEPSTSLQKNVLYKAMMDCELVLRFFAIRDSVRGDARGSLREILDKTMARYSKFEQSVVNVLKSEFLGALSRVTQALGLQFHHLPGAVPSRPLYDAILVAVDSLPTVNLDADAAAIRARLQHALDTPEKYDILVGRGNTVSAIKARVELARQILVEQ